MKFPAAMLLLCSGLVAAGPEPVVTGSYYAVIVSDIEVAAAWYRETLGLGETTRLGEAGRYDIVNLARPGLAVELLSLAAAAPRPEGYLRGAFKVGMLVADLEEFIDSLPETIPPPQVIQDDDNGFRLVQLRDPDGNIVQVMERRAEEP